jgi:hypothetical protein
VVGWVSQPAGRLTHHPKVATDAKRIPSAGEHDRADCRIGDQLFGGAEQLDGQRRREHVELGRVRQTQDRKFAEAVNLHQRALIGAGGGQNLGIGHLH